MKLIFVRKFDECRMLHRFNCQNNIQNQCNHTISEFCMLFSFICRWSEQYKWNKVTTCVHNLLGGQRWVDQYGEMQISCGEIVCKITFKKVSFCM